MGLTSTVAARQEGIAISVIANLPGQVTHRAGNNSGLNGRATRRRKRAISAVTCAQAVALLADYISGEIKAADRLAFESHQQICPDCVAFLRTYRKTIELSRSFLRLRGAAPSGSLSLRR